MLNKELNGEISKKEMSPPFQGGDICCAAINGGGCWIRSYSIIENYHSRSYSFNLPALRAPLLAAPGGEIYEV
jgi:hypothetical protein